MSARVWRQRRAKKRRDRRPWPFPAYWDGSVGSAIGDATIMSTDLLQPDRFGPAPIEEVADIIAKAYAMMRALGLRERFGD